MKKINTYNWWAKIIEGHHKHCFMFTNAPLTVLYYNDSTPIIYFNIIKINLNSASNI